MMNTYRWSPPRRPPPSGAAAAGRDELVKDTTAWTERMWTRAHPEWAAAVSELSSRQRLLLGIVIFGRLRYQTVATLTGLDPALVTTHCAAGMLHLRASLHDR